MVSQNNLGICAVGTVVVLNNLVGFDENARLNLIMQLVYPVKLQLHTNDIQRHNFNEFVVIVLHFMPENDF